MNSVSIKEIMSEKGWKLSDSGKVGKASELAVRRMVQPGSKRNNAVTTNYKWYGDFYKKTVDGKMIKFEVKTACGELVVGQSDNLSIDDIADIDYILYAPYIDINDNVLNQFYVFSRSQFIDMVKGYNGKGKITRIKKPTNGNGFRLSFQSFYSDTRKTASKKIASYIVACCCNCPLASEFFAQ